LRLSLAAGPALAAAACGSKPQVLPVPTLVGEPTATPPPAPTATPTGIAARPEGVWVDFVAMWNRRDYGAMYDLVSAGARAANSPEAFEGYFEDLRRQAGISQGPTEITSSLVTGATAQVGFRKTLTSAVFGAIE